jgi:hypothetical protein
MTNLRWQDVVNLLLGVWIGASPWALGFADAFPLASWNALAVGAAVIVLAAVDLDAPALWEEWLLGALGLWLVLAPWVLGFAQAREPMLSSVVSGALVAALAAWALYAAGSVHRDHLPSH